ncbi:MAG TPA: hypothetical protein VLV89_04715 [Candidatus Acidoferrum sp.]|nr:hypothetical protein [Candidatus Acidoferrum sp.]
MSPSPPNCFPRTALVMAALQVALQMDAQARVAGRAASQREPNLAAAAAQAALASPQLDPFPPNYSPKGRQRAEKAELASQVTD